MGHDVHSVVEMRSITEPVLLQILNDQAEWEHVITAVTTLPEPPYVANLDLAMLKTCHALIYLLE